MRRSPGSKAFLTIMSSSLGRSSKLLGQLMAQNIGKWWWWSVEEKEEKARLRPLQTGNKVGGHRIAGGWWPLRYSQCYDRIYVTKADA